MAGKKPTKAQIEERVSFVYKALILSLPRHEVVSQCISKFNVSDRTVDSYIQKAWDKIADDSASDRKRYRQVALARYGRIFNQTLVKGDYKTAISAQEKIDKLNFLYDLTDDEKQIAREKFDGFEFKMITKSEEVPEDEQ